MVQERKLADPAARIRLMPEPLPLGRARQDGSALDSHDGERKADADLGLLSLLSTPEAAFAVDHEGFIVYWNEAAEQLMGLARDDVIGVRCSQVFKQNKEGGRVVCPGNCRSLAAAQLGQMRPHQDLMVRETDGRLCSLVVSPLLWNSPAGELAFLLHVVRESRPEKRTDWLLGALQSLLESEGRLVGARAPAIEPVPHTLTRREIQVLELLANGARTQDVAVELCISRATARHHIDNIMDKLGVHSRLEAVVYARRHHLIR